jgi:effector-binding domain-containing protein
MPGGAAATHDFFAIPWLSLALRESSGIKAMEAAIDTQESKIREVFFFSACYDTQVTRYLGPVARGRAGPRFIKTHLLIAVDMFVPYEGETPMITEPKVEDRGAQHYVAIRTQATMQELDTAIPQRLGEVFAWLAHQGVAPSGAPFARYLVIDMEALLDIEVGVPVVTALSGDDRICAGVLPVGRYASLVYTGIDIGIKANWALLKWGVEKGLAWDTWKTEQGDAFGARLESFLTNPDEETDRAKWETEVAIRLAEHQPQEQ